jgi:hypothetical protein
MNLLYGEGDDPPQVKVARPLDHLRIDEVGAEALDIGDGQVERLRV